MKTSEKVRELKKALWGEQAISSDFMATLVAEVEALEAERDTLEEALVVKLREAFEVDQRTVARNAKREAYKHAQRIVRVTPQGSAYDEVIQRAIDALDEETTDE
jgi:hypothetical protein